MDKPESTMVVNLSPLKFLLISFLGAALMIGLGRWIRFSPEFLALEVFLTVVALFLFGSIRYRLDKNALTYGAILIIGATFWTMWWPASHLKASFQSSGWVSLLQFFQHHFLTLHGLDNLVHADTMLFILGLTFFVAVIAQTRILETISFSVLNRTKGNVVVTVGILTALVAFASGILDGVSMIGLMIRTLVIILFLAKAEEVHVIFSVLVSTLITTVCGMWLAYGEPPNLIMKANLHPLLDNAFFLRYCLPAAIGSYVVVFWNVRKHLKGKKVDIKSLDILDLNTANVRFLQARRHGEVLTPVEFVEDHKERLGPQWEGIIHRLHQGEPLGLAMIKENVPSSTRQDILGHFVAEDLALALDDHYTDALKGADESTERSHREINMALAGAAKDRAFAQTLGAVAFIPFIGLLILHAFNHTIPLFWASFAGFAVAVVGIFSLPKVRKLALKEAWHEYQEYLFLFPLFFSITLLQKSGFFSEIAHLLRQGIDSLGLSHVAYLQFGGATFLSALLDNNVVADFSARALQGLEVTAVHLFAMAQIAGYAVGGCWTHIGSAQSVVAYAFLRKEVNNNYTPFQWIKAMTPIVLQLCLLMAGIIYLEAWLLK